VFGCGVVWGVGVEGGLSRVKPDNCTRTLNSYNVGHLGRNCKLPLVVSALSKQIHALGSRDERRGTYAAEMLSLQIGQIHATDTR
jgi:hypothetical protein